MTPLTGPAPATSAPTPWSAPVRRTALRTLQLNLGRYCNLACTHCHVDAGPARREMMDAATQRRVCAWIGRHRPPVVDLTGGAPELIPAFRPIVAAARDAGSAVLDRCNLVVLDEPGQEDLVGFLASHHVTVVASLPCHQAGNVDRQRGRGVFERSIDGLRRLNAAGYGIDGARRLFLVFNPGGAALPPPQGALEREYRTRLRADWGVEFTGLWCMTNVPIRRFRRHLERSGKLGEYESLLASAYNPGTLEGLMCRSTLSVDHDGRVYDCDFNLAEGIALGGTDGGLRLWDIDPASLAARPVAMARHCLACTAGPGSSCTGAVS